MATKGREPSYEEKETTLEKIQEYNDKAPWDELTRFIAGIQPGEKLFWYKVVRASSGGSGFYRLLADGTKVHIATISWMS